MKPCVQIMGHRGCYRPRRPVLIQPPEISATLFRPVGANADLWTWQRCCHCRREFRVVIEGEPLDVILLTCSRSCAKQSVTREALDTTTSLPKSRVGKRTREEWIAWMGRSA